MPVDMLNISNGRRELIVADEDARKNVLVHGSTVYYGGPTVTASSNDGEIADGDDHGFDQSKYVISGGSSQLVISEGSTSESIETVTVDYGGPDSFQPQAADLNLAAGAGTSEDGDHAYLGGQMGNVLGADLAGEHNTVAGQIAAYNVTGTNASTYPKGAHVAEIGDGTSTANGSYVAALGGDSEVTTAGAAFKVMSNNSTPGSGFEFGLDLQDAAHDGYNAVSYTKGEARLLHDAVVFTNAGAPSDGTTLDNVAGKGSLCIDVTNGVLYINTGTLASSTWVKVGTQS